MLHTTSFVLSIVRMMNNKKPSKVFSDPRLLEYETQKTQRSTSIHRPDVIFYLLLCVGEVGSSTKAISASAHILVLDRLILVYQLLKGMI